MIKEKIKYWLSRTKKIPSYVRRFGILRAVCHTFELIRHPCLNLEISAIEREKIAERHAFLSANWSGALASGDWKQLEKVGVLAERASISLETRKFQEMRSFVRKTKFSIVVPLYNTPALFLGEMIFSVLEQTYPDWELCLADASDVEHSDVEAMVRFFAGKDVRVKYRRLNKNGGISANTNAAIEMATGDFIVLCDHDDILHPSALFYVADAVAKNAADFVYTDECTFESDAGYVSRGIPYFKPDFSPDTLRGNNYICHLTAFKRSLMLSAGGGFCSEYDGSQDYDIILRLTEKASNIVHIPKVLYFWRAHSGSVASMRGAEVKQYAIEAGRKAIQASLERNGLRGTVEAGGRFPTFYRIRYEISRPGLVSIVIPTKNHVEDLQKCVTSIFEKTTWRDYEVLIVDNGSTDPAIANYYAKLAESGKARILHYNQPFNYSKINNFAAGQAKGKYLLFLNNDTEVISPGWIEEMLMYAQRPDIGAVGAMLYFGDNTIQHAGVIVGIGGVAGHVFSREPRGAPGYFGHALIACNYSAVTAACVMMRAEVFRDVGGFDESFAVAFNDIDLCLRVLAKGYRNIWTPHAELYHYESKSRGHEDTPEKQLRFKGEIVRFIERWEKFLDAGDPFYNPNFKCFTACYSE